MSKSPVLPKKPGPKPGPKPPEAEIPVAPEPKPAPEPIPEPVPEPEPPPEPPPVLNTEARQFIVRHGAKMTLDGRRRQPGEVVTLTKEQAQNWRDLIQPVP